MKKIKLFIREVGIWYEETTKKIADFFIELLDNHGLYIMFGFVTIVALIVRYALVSMTSGDSYWFLIPWTKYIRANGGLLSLKEIPISYYTTNLGTNIPYGNITAGHTITGEVRGNYPSFYYFLLALISPLPISELAVIKTVSFIFDFALAIAIVKIVKELKGDNKALLVGTYALALFLPTFLINSAIWGQSDAVYGGMALWFIYFLMTNKPKTSMVMIGIALSIKVQIIFILPLVGLLFLRKKFKLVHLLIIPVVTFISFLPAYIAGAPFMMPIRQVTDVASTYSRPNMNSGSIYALFENITSRFTPTIPNLGVTITTLFGIPLALGIFIIVIYIIYEKNIAITPRSLVALGALFAMLSPFVLPYMHERYFFMGDAFVLLFVIIFKKKWHLLLLSQLASLITYSNFILGGWLFPPLAKGNLVLAAIINVIIISVLLKHILTLPTADELTEYETMQLELQ